MRRWPVYTDPIRRADALRRALHDLKDAQELIRMAQAPYVLLKVKAARRSLEGAIRHAQGRTARNDHTRSVTKAKRPRRIGQGDVSPTPYLDDFREHVRRSYQK